jgi:tetratricopeptide (TPR) repeat protein
VAFEVLAGEVAAADSDISKAVNHFKSAVELEDQLIYSEPSAWHIPPRQNLGVLLLESGQYAEAEMVYRKDLEDLRQNGWSLTGLHQSLKAQGKEAEALEVKHELDRAWQHADIALERSVL